MLRSVTRNGYLLILMSALFRKEIIWLEKFAENANITSILQQKRNFIVAILIVIITECRLCMTIVAKILKKRAIKGGKEK